MPFQSMDTILRLEGFKGSLSRYRSEALVPAFNLEDLVKRCDTHETILKISRFRLRSLSTV
jgi:hypothetical protein